MLNCWSVLNTQMDLITTNIKYIGQIMWLKSRLAKDMLKIIIISWHKQHFLNDKILPLLSFEHYDDNYFHLYAMEKFKYQFIMTLYISLSKIWRNVKRSSKIFIIYTECMLPIIGFAGQQDGMFRFICILSSTTMATKIDLIGKLQCTRTID